MSDHDWKTCKDENCKECCMHDDNDHLICLNCGAELDPFIEVECE
jgi:hypothetical protein